MISHEIRVIFYSVCVWLLFLLNEGYVWETVIVNSNELQN